VVRRPGELSLRFDTCNFSFVMCLYYYAILLVDGKGKSVLSP